MKIIFVISVEGGWTEQLGLRFDQLFPDHAKGAHPDAIKELESCLAEDMKDQDGIPYLQLSKLALSFQNSVLSVSTRGKMLMNVRKSLQCHANTSSIQLAYLSGLKRFPVVQSDVILHSIIQANSCPACRHELPSHDPLYEEYQRQQVSSHYNRSRKPFFLFRNVKKLVKGILKSFTTQCTRR